MGSADPPDGEERDGDAMAGLAHEFNNLLTVLSGSIVLAERHAGGNEALLRLLGHMRAATDRAEALTKRLAAIEHPHPSLEMKLNLLDL